MKPEAVNIKKYLSYPVGEIGQFPSRKLYSNSKPNLDNKNFEVFNKCTFHVYCS